MQKAVSIDVADTAMEYAVSQEDALLDVPEYLQETYWWAYLHPRAVKFFERQWMVNLILWGNFTRLSKAALDEMGQVITGRSLQIACVYGDFTPQLTQRMAPEARLDVVDVAPIQLQNLRRKIGRRDNVFLHRQNAASLSFSDAEFDQIAVFFLLHEMPADVRLATVREALRTVKPGGKVVFVDYHRPVWQHPHRYLMRPILKTLEPFALDLWETEIADWLSADFPPAKIEKSLYFGGLYQKLVITR